MRVQSHRTDKMARVVIISIIPMLFTTVSALSLPHHDPEAHSIIKRMAEANEEFEGYDVARIFSMGARREKRLVKRDAGQSGNIRFTNEDLRSLQLHLSSGSKVNLALVPANILDPDTVVSYQTPDGRTERKWEGDNCFSYGHLEDSSGKGMAAISHCNGIFGYAKTPSYDYLVYPVDTKRFKRDVGREDYDVHLMWRRSAAEKSENTTDSSADIEEDPEMPTDDVLSISNESMVETPTYENVVIEMALFSDERYWNKLHKAFRERVNDYMLTMVAGTQALFGNPERVGYNVQIKVKLLEYWKINPDGYEFKDSTPKNLRSFCKYTTRKYKYDVHALNSGIRAYEKGLVGLAYLGKACSKRHRCFVKKTFGLKSFSLLAHELGHTLGMPHQSRAKCPTTERYYGGFMGGGRMYNFSPCMKHYLSKFLKSRKSNCLFTESNSTESSNTGNELPRMFPGQIKSPNELCEVLAGTGYNYVPVGLSLGHSTCLWMVCYNENETSPEFRRAKQFFAPAGFPCGKESFCVKERECKPWNMTQTVFDYEALSNITIPPEWSEWSTEVSKCSRSCGTGVRTRRRECRFTGYNLAPYCPGMAVKAELCNTDPCPGEPTNKGELRRARGNKICENFLKNNVTLNLRKANGYLPTAANLTKGNTILPARIEQVHSRSCMMKCERDPVQRRGVLDAFMPDGTPCYDTTRWERELKTLNIDLRCVRGSCLEFTNCPNEQPKDECGVCGGNRQRCVSLSFDSSYDVPRGMRSYLATIPAGSTNINVRMNGKKNKGVILEMWSYDDRNIIGKSGLYSGSNYEDSDAVQHAGSEWFYRQTVAYFHAPGPTQESVIIKAFRQGHPIKMITIQYARREETQNSVSTNDMAAG